MLPGTGRMRRRRLKDSTPIVSFVFVTQDGFEPHHAHHASSRQSPDFNFQPNTTLTTMRSVSALALALASALSATDAFVPASSAFGLSRLSSSGVILKAEIRGPTEKSEGNA